MQRGGHNVSILYIAYKFSRLIALGLGLNSEQNDTMTSMARWCLWHTVNELQLSAE